MAFSQASVCSPSFTVSFVMLLKLNMEVKKNGCIMHNRKVDYLIKGMTSKIRYVIYKGMDYRINVCVETGDKLNYKIFDARTNELL